MIQDLPKEIWKDIIFDEIILDEEMFQVSNMGRIKNLRETKKYPFGRIVTFGEKSRYCLFSVRKKEGKIKKRLLAHRIVAHHFLDKPIGNRKFIIHLDYDNKNNKPENLKWVNEAEQAEHTVKKRGGNIKRLNIFNSVTSFANEKWATIVFEDNILETEKFEVSNLGRLKKVLDNKEFKIIRPGSVGKYLALRVVQKSKKSTSVYLHRLVATYFLPKEKGENLVIHLDRDNYNNEVSNLRWVDSKGKEAHKLSSPGGRRTNAKLTEGRVRILKKKLLDPNRKTRLKMLAKQFGVSEMQLQRIRTGENWGHVKV